MVVDAVGDAGGAERIAVLVEHGESVALLQDARAAFLQRGNGGNDERSCCDIVVHQATRSASAASRKRYSGESGGASGTPGSAR